MPCLVKIVGLVQDQKSPFDGEFLKEYDPNQDGRDPWGRPMTAHLVTTLNLLEAKKFDDASAALEFWKLVDERCPLRPDSKPNRPLTAFSVEIVNMDLIP